MSSGNQIAGNLEEAGSSLEDNNSMAGFIRRCVSACWAAYTEISGLLDADYYRVIDKYEQIDADKYNMRREVKSWLYDAASVLTIVTHDGKLLSLLSEWYERDGGIPWDKEGDWRN
jgi:hypothetical protein